MNQDDLGRQLTRLAERTAPLPRSELAGVVVAAHRQQRRQRVGVGAVVAALVAVVVAVPMVLSGPSDSGGVAQAREVDVLAGPTRGSLASDAAFVEAVRQLSWTDPDVTAGTGAPDAPLDSRHVVFAGDVAGERWALVTGTDADPVGVNDPLAPTDPGSVSGVAAAWFTGPAGASGDQLQLAGMPRGIDPERPAAVVDRVTGGMVVVTAPGDTVQISTRPDVAADATVTRGWLPVDVQDGIAVITLDPGGVEGPALAYRVIRDGDVLVTTGPDSYADDVGGPADLPVTWLRTAPSSSPADIMLDNELPHVLGQLGLRSDEVAFTVLWAGDVPAPADHPARVHLISATLPSGATFTEALLSLDMDGYVGGGFCGIGLQPAGVPLAEQTFAVQCDVTDFSGQSTTLSSLVVVGPAQAVTAVAVDAAGTPLTTVPLADGVAVVPYPDGTATVQTLTPDGTVLATVTPLGYADLGD